MEESGTSKEVRRGGEKGGGGNEGGMKEEKKRRQYVQGSQKGGLESKEE